MFSVCDGEQDDERGTVSRRGQVRGLREANLVVEPAFGLEVVEELAVRLAAPEVHTRYLEIAPDYATPVSGLERTRMRGMTRTMAHVVGVASVVR